MTLCTDAPHSQSSKSSPSQYTSPFQIYSLILLPQSPSIPISPQPIRASRTPPIRNRQSVSSSTSTTEPPTPIHPISRISLQPPRQIHAPEICHADRRARPGTQQTIQQRARIDVSTIARPARRERGARIPAHREGKGKGVADRDFSIAGVRCDGVCGCCVDGARGD